MRPILIFFPVPSLPSPSIRSHSTTLVLYCVRTVFRVRVHADISVLSGSGHYLEFRMSGLNMSGQHVSSDMSAPAPSGYASSTSTLSPSPQTKQTNCGSDPTSLRVGSMYEFGNVSISGHSCGMLLTLVVKVPPNELMAARRGSIPPCVVVPSPVGTPDHSSHPHDHGMYAANIAGGMKYPAQAWNSGSGGYVPQQPRFSSHDTRSFIPDGTTSGAYPQAQHHHPVPQQRQQSHPMTPELVYPADDGSYPFSDPTSVSAPIPTALSLHGMPNRGYVVGPTPPHSAPPHVGEYPGGGPYHGQEAWGVHGT